MNHWEFRRRVRAERQWLHCKCPLGLALAGYEPAPACIAAAAELGLDENYCFGVTMGIVAGRSGSEP